LGEYAAGAALAIMRAPAVWTVGRDDSYVPGADPAICLGVWFLALCGFPVRAVPARMGTMCGMGMLAPGAGPPSDKIRAVLDTVFGVPVTQLGSWALAWVDGPTPEQVRAALTTAGFGAHLLNTVVAVSDWPGRDPDRDTDTAVGVDLTRKIRVRTAALVIWRAVRSGRLVLPATGSCADDVAVAAFAEEIFEEHAFPVSGPDPADPGEDLVATLLVDAIGGMDERFTVPAAQLCTAIMEFGGPAGLEATIAQLI
jgi:hypothetical protein